MDTAMLDEEPELWRLYAWWRERAGPGPAPLVVGANPSPQAGESRHGVDRIKRCVVRFFLTNPDRRLFTS